MFYLLHQIRVVKAMHARPALRLHGEQGLETQNLTAVKLNSNPTLLHPHLLRGAGWRGNKNAICISLLIYQTPSYWSAPPQPFLELALHLIMAQVISYRSIRGGYENISNTHTHTHNVILKWFNFLSSFVTDLKSLLKNRNWIHKLFIPLNQIHFSSSSKMNSLPPTLAVFLSSPGTNHCVSTIINDRRAEWKRSIVRRLLCQHSPEGKHQGRL